MRISVAQIRPFKGDIQKNIKAHLRLVKTAVALKADAIFFPELSLTSYQSAFAKAWALSKEDQRLTVFQETSDRDKITIGLGAPTKAANGVRISILLFQPDQSTLSYSKQILHEDELPYFVTGFEQIYLSVKGEKIAPAICYESMLEEHAQQAVKNGSTIYLTSVAKSKEGVQRSFEHYPKIARKYSIPVLMSNCVGSCDEVESVGTSAVWNKKGELMGQLDQMSEGVLVWDTATDELVFA